MPVLVGDTIRCFAHALVMKPDGTQTVDDTAILTDVVFTFSDPAQFTVDAQGSNYVYFHGAAPSAGQSLTVTGKNANGDVLTASGLIPEVQAVQPPPPPVASGIQLEFQPPA